MGKIKTFSASIVASIFLFFVPGAFASAADPISVTNYSAPGGSISISLTNTTGSSIDVYYLSEGTSFFYYWFDVVSGDCVSHNMIPDSNRELTVPAGASCTVFPNGVQDIPTHNHENVHTAITLEQLTALEFSPNAFTRAYIIPPDNWSNFETPVYFGTEPPPAGPIFVFPGWAAPILTPTYPPAAAQTVRFDLDFHATGSVAVATSSTYSWKTLTATFQKIESTGPGTQTYSASYDFIPLLAPGDSQSYDIDIGALSLPDGAYKVLYRIWADTLLPHSISYADDNTIVRNEALPAGWDTPEEGNYTAPEEEDCSTQGLPNRWFCEIKNAITGLIIPSHAKLEELKATIAEVSNRAPFNYLASAQTDFTVIVQNTTSSPVSITIFGSTGTLDNNALINSGLSTIIQSVFGFILLVLFVFWGINYIKRIF